MTAASFGGRRTESCRAFRSALSFAVEHQICALAAARAFWCGFAKPNAPPLGGPAAGALGSCRVRQPPGSSWRGFSGTLLSFCCDPWRRSAMSREFDMIRSCIAAAAVAFRGTVVLAQEGRRRSLGYFQ
jgi:hypothetical protein